MKIEKIWAVSYSAVGSTDRVVRTIAQNLAQKLGLPWETLPFTRISEREKELSLIHI